MCLYMHVYVYIRADMHVYRVSNGVAVVFTATVAYIYIAQVIQEL
jgi:hypothetical protein